MSNDGKYAPFDLVEGVYEASDQGMTMYRILQAFQGMLSIPPVVVRTPFKNLIREVVAGEYPHFRCSAARAILEGRVEGVPKPVDPIHPMWRKRVQQALYLLDLMETICYRSVQESLSRMSPEIQREVRDVQESVGSVKVPRLIQTVYNLEGEVETPSGSRHASCRTSKHRNVKTSKGEKHERVGKGKAKKGRESKKEVQEVPV